MIGFSLVLILFQVSLGSSWVLQPRAGCNIVISDLDPEPVVVTASGFQFLYPEPDASSVSLTAGQDVIISCPGGTLSAGSTSLGQTVTARCSSGTTFTINSQSINFNQIVCSRNPYHTARYTGNSCELGGREIEIGFVLDSSRFARQMIVCFDETTKSAFYSEFDLTRSIGHSESGVPRPSFVEDSFYNLGVTVNSLYVRNGQTTTINSLLGLPANSTKYISDSSDYYLARGHFTAKADYVYAPQQQATFHYCNAAPQWQTFNGDNWNILETNVRKYAESNQLDLKVWTGPYGVTTLPHEQTGRATPLYLYVDSNGNTAIPVPELFWKVVYDPNSKLGVAFLGLNNPYQTSLGSSLICTDVSSRISWLSWKPTNQKSGFSYACTVDDLRRSVPQLPQFETRGLLV